MKTHALFGGGNKEVRVHAAVLGSKDSIAALATAACMHYAAARTYGFTLCINNIDMYPVRIACCSDARRVAEVVCPTHLTWASSWNQ